MTQIKAVRRKGRGCPLAVAAFQHLTQPLRRMLALADIDQAADDVAHHVMQEGIRGQVKKNGVALLPDIELREVLDRCLGLAFRGTEGTEVVLAQQVSGRLTHLRHIQRHVEPADLSVVHGTARRPVDQHVLVAACLCRKARVKFVWDGMRPQHRDVFRQQRVRATHPGSEWPLDVRIEMHHLFQRMHAGIGAPRGQDSNAAARNTAQRRLQGILHVRHIRLALPPVVAATIVFHTERNPHRHTPISNAALAVNNTASTTPKACSRNSTCSAPVAAGRKASWMVARQSLAVSRMADSAYSSVNARRTAIRSRDRPNQRSGYASVYKPLMSCVCGSSTSRIA